MSERVLSRDITAILPSLVESDTTDSTGQELQSHFSRPPTQNSEASKLTTLNKRSDPLTSLPLEIITIIFGLCSSTSIHELFKLGAICSSWRRIAWTAPSVWQEFALVIRPERLGTTIALTQELLERSMNAALSIEVIVPQYNDPISQPKLWNAHIDSFVQFANIVKAASNRWQNIYLSMPSALLRHFAGTDIRNLKVIQIHNTDGTHVQVLESVTQATKVKTIDFLGPEETGKWNEAYPTPISLTIINVLLGSINVDWRKLTQVTATDIDLSDICILLREAPLIESFSLFDFRINPYPVPARLIHVNHTVLKELSIETMGSTDLDTLLDHLTLPFLETLMVQQHDVFGTLGSHKGFVTFFERSACQLANLKLGVCFGRDFSLVTLMRAIPSLTKLVLLPQGWSSGCTLVNLFKELSRSPRDNILGEHVNEFDETSTNFLCNLNCFEYYPRLPEEWEQIWPFVPGIFGVHSNSNAKAPDNTENALKRSLTHFGVVYLPSGRDRRNDPPLPTDEIQEKLVRMTELGIKIDVTKFSHGMKKEKPIFPLLQVNKCPRGCEFETRGLP